MHSAVTPDSAIEGVIGGKPGGTVRTDEMDRLLVTRLNIVELIESCNCHREGNSCRRVPRSIDGQVRHHPGIHKNTQRSVDRRSRDVGGGDGLTSSSSEYHSTDKRVHPVVCKRERIVRRYCRRGIGAGEMNGAGVAGRDIVVGVQSGHEDVESVYRVIEEKWCGYREVCRRTRNDDLHDLLNATQTVHQYRGPVVAGRKTAHQRRCEGLA